LFIGWQLAHTFGAFLGMGLLLGVAGASFAVALPLASAWYPPELQGLAMGIAGAGNSGTLLSTLFAPRLAQAFGWHNVFAFAAIPVLLAWAIFFLRAKDAPKPRHVKTWAEYAAILKLGDTGWFCFLYGLTFGGFSGLTSYLSIFFHDQYHLTKIQAGDFTTFVVLFGSFLRPVGGALSDRLGGYRVLLWLFTGAAVSIAFVATLPPVMVALALLAFCMAMLGMGNGSVFQLVPQRFSDQVGIMTGIVGAAGGFGGFLLPSVFGALKDETRSFCSGFIVLAVCLLGGVSALLALKNSWSQNWSRAAAIRAGLLADHPTKESASAIYVSH
jgi:NNP family nitrate/nitrite transporter-like MFS transporter